MRAGCRDGGEPQVDSGDITAQVREDPDAARAAIDDFEVPVQVAAEIILALEALENK
jgi:hypothetical protein